MKRFICTILTLAVVLSSFGTIAFASSDYSGHWSEETINAFIEEGIIAEDEHGNVRPDANILRCEFVKIINRYFGYTDKAEVNFNDVASDKWYAEEFLIAKSAGYITGDENKNASPEKNITRAEVCVILSRLLNLEKTGDVTFADDADIPDWAKDSVYKVAAAGYIKGYEDGSVKAQGNITRAESITLISRTKKPEKQPEENTEKEETNTENTTGNITGMNNTTVSGGSGGGGGGVSRPTGVIPSVIDIRNFNKDTFTLELVAKFVKNFEFYVNVGDDSYTYNNVLYTAKGNSYSFELKDIIYRTMETRGVSGEEYTITVKGIAVPGSENTSSYEVFKGTVSVDLPVVSDLKASYNYVNDAYTSAEYKLEWKNVENVSKYIYSVYNSEETDATAVFEGTVEKADIPDGAQTVSVALPVDEAWGSRDNLYFTVKAMDEESSIVGEPSEKKYLVLDAPVISGLAYLENDKYEIQYIKDSNATYKTYVGESELTDGKTYTALAEDKNKTVSLKAYYEDNETATAKIDFDFSFGGGNGSDTPYKIYNQRHFSNIKNSPDKKFELQNDLNLTADYQTIEGFKGELDGNDYTIDFGTRTQGIFNMVEGKTVFKDLTIKGTVSGDKIVGALIGEFKAGNDVVSLIENCTNYANITSAATSNARAGAFVGSSYQTGMITFNNCVNFGNITSLGNGSNAAGGLAGLVSLTKINSCVNYGNISTKLRSGGLVGFVYVEITAQNSANFGNVDASDIDPTCGSGGIAGTLSDKYCTGVSIVGCLNAGRVKGNNAGGIVGFFVDKGKIVDCINVGSTSSAFVGAGGQAKNIVNSYYLGSVSSDTLGGTKKTDPELKGESPVNTFDYQEGFSYPVPNSITYVSLELLNAVKISTVADFKAIANSPDGVYVLENNITLDESYVPISNFSGILNGNGYTIDIGNKVSGRNGLFNSIAGGTVKNLTIKGKILYGGHAGGFAATIPTGKTAEFINCKNYVDINISGQNQYAGGFVGWAYQSGAVTFENCINYGKITAGTNACVGGVIGIGSAPSFISCVNYGAVTVTTYGKSGGGLIGYVYGITTADGCANFGDVVNSANGTVMGGIAGAVAGYTSAINVKNSINAGKVYNGVAGSFAATKSTGSAIGFINVGDTTNTIAPSTVTSMSVSDSYYLADSGAGFTGAVSKTADELKVLDLAGFSLQTGYDYPLPDGITYSPLN